MYNCEDVDYVPDSSRVPRVTGGGTWFGDGIEKSSERSFWWRSSLEWGSRWVSIGRVFASGVGHGWARAGGVWLVGKSKRSKMQKNNNHASAIHEVANGKRKKRNILLIEAETDTNILTRVRERKGDQSSFAFDGSRGTKCDVVI
ncbi:hypothetical protein KM043_001179 [Ampulex compressa]|nr:hypothetical protein KM043_001179 [Ampulex compressa]